MGTLFSTISELSASGIYPSVVPMVMKAIQRHPLLSLFEYGPPMVGDSTQKIEWEDDSIDPLTATLQANYTAGSGTFTVAATDDVQVGDILSFRNHADTAGRQPKFRVTANAAGVLTVVVVASAGADTSAAVATYPVVDVDRAILDNAAAGTTGKAQQPVVNSNYLQTFQTDLILGNKALGKVRYGQIKGWEDSVFENAMLAAVNKLLGFIDTAILRGIAQAESASLAARMAGLDAQIFTTSTVNVVNASASTLDEGELNTLVEQLINRNADAAGNYVLLTSVKNSRVLGALRYAKTTYDTLEATGAELGGTVTRFNSEVAGVRMDVVWHPRMGDNRVLLIDRNRVKLIPTANIREDAGGTVGAIPQFADLPESMGATDGWAWMVNSTTPGTDGSKWTMRAELSLAVYNALSCHGVVRSIVP